MKITPRRMLRGCKPPPLQTPPRRATGSLRPVPPLAVRRAAGTPVTRRVTGGSSAPSALRGTAYNGSVRMAVAPSAPVCAREKAQEDGVAAPRPYRFPRQPRQPPDPRQPRHPLKILHRLGASWGFSRDASLFPASLRLALRPPARKLRGLRQGEPRRPLCPPAAALRVRAGAQAHPVRFQERSLSGRSQPRRADTRFPSAVSPSGPLGAGVELPAAALGIVRLEYS